MSYNSKYTGAEVDAALGLAKSALQEHQDLSKYVTTEALTEALSGKVDKVDGKQLSTEDFTTALKSKLGGLSNYDDTEISEAVESLRSDFDELVSGDTTTAIASFNEVVAFLEGIEDSEDLNSIVASIEQQIAAKYTKPSDGIPKSDLSSEVQSAVSMAYTALQEEIYMGTVTGITMNGESKGTIGVVDLGTVITEHQDISGKQDTISDLEGIRSGAALGATALQPTTEGDGTKFLADDNTYKEIKVLPEGGTSGQVLTQTGTGAVWADAQGGDLSVPIIDHGTDDTTYSIEPNVYHKWGSVASLSLTLATAEDTTAANYYMVEFTSGTTATTLSVPDTITWSTDINISANKTYQISIVNNLGVIGEF